MPLVALVASAEWLSPLSEIHRTEQVSEARHEVGYAFCHGEDFPFRRAPHRVVRDNPVKMSDTEHNHGIGSGDEFVLANIFPANM